MREARQWAQTTLNIIRSNPVAVLVTGASGFVGRHLLRALEWHRVKSVVRRPLDESNNPSTTLVYGDIDGNTDWRQALIGIDCIVHLAAHVHVMKTGPTERLRFHDTNVMGTRALAKAAVLAGVKRFIFLSSVKVNGELTSGIPFRADDTPNPVDDYGISKRDAENALFEIAGLSTMEVIAIRAPLVYGPNVKGNFLRLLSWIYRRLPLPFGAVNNERSLVSVWNLCSLVRCIVEAPRLKSGVVMVSDGDDVSTPDLVHKLARAMGKPARLVQCPVRLLELAGTLSGRSAEVERLCRSLTVDIGETRRQFSWAPVLSLDEGLDRTANWYLKEMEADHG